VFAHVAVTSNFCATQSAAAGCLNLSSTVGKTELQSVAEERLQKQRQKLHKEQCISYGVMAPQLRKCSQRQQQCQFHFAGRTQLAVHVPGITQCHAAWAEHNRAQHTLQEHLSGYSSLNSYRAAPRSQAGEMQNRQGNKQLAPGAAHCCWQHLLQLCPKVHPSSHTINNA
jgi:hypothetical protein